MSEKFPIIFDCCPHCGQRETITQVAAKKLIENGAIKKGAILARRKEVTPMIEPNQVSISVPALITFWDVCYNCGKEYVTRVEYQNLPVRMQIMDKGKGGGGFPYNFPIGKG